MERFLIRKPKQTEPVPVASTSRMITENEVNESEEGDGDMQIEDDEVLEIATARVSIEGRGESRPQPKKKVNDKMEKSVTREEFNALGFLHEHNLPFIVMDHLIPLLANIFPDSEIAKAAVDRILENWDAFALYFRMECAEEDLNSIKTILRSLEHPAYKINCPFLSYVLELVNKFNLEFQAEKPKLYTLSTKVSDLCRNLLRNFLKKTYIEGSDLKNINSSDPSNFLPLESMYFGTKTELLTAREGVDQAELHNFRLGALDFYIELSRQIKKRFNFSDPLLNFLKILDPNVAVSGEIGSIAVCSLQYFPNLVDNVENLNSG
ncbi:unnamed protein product [Ceutorhynchus assimilis]|uniref:Uncharacterized protein n=1 Tax=Ceutorhynchus assimilis TaxID=467358 RepID=A0A9N9QG78_9CUCU|nr:unnamed protein product [Ceutorhynchus assimilis]